MGSKDRDGMFNKRELYQGEDGRPVSVGPVSDQDQPYFADNNRWERVRRLGWGSQLSPSEQFCYGRLLLLRSNALERGLVKRVGQHPLNALLDAQARRFAETA